MTNKTIIIMSGFPGSGKSTLAKKISKKLNFEYLSSDLIRKEIYNSDHFDQSGHEFYKSITKKIYDELYKRAIILESQNKKIIIDGTHLHKNKREQSLKKLLKSIEPNKIVLITVKTPYKIIEKRMSSKNKDTFKGWKKVYGEFIREEKEGLISWPDNSLGIDIIDSKDIYAQLA